MEKKIENIKKEFNFSRAGKNSMKKYSYIIDKNKETNDRILKDKNRKKVFDDFFQSNVNPTPNIDDIDSYYFNEDIFSKNYNPKIINSAANKNQKNKREFQVKSSCSYLNKKKNIDYNLYRIRSNIINNYYDKSFDKFKYHLLHHNEDNNIDNNEKKMITPSCTRYNPKLDYISKKMIYSIYFKKMSGRKEKSPIPRNKNVNADMDVDVDAEVTKLKKNKDVNVMKLIKNKNKFKNIDIKQQQKLKLNSARNPIKLYKNENFIPGSISMKYQLSRQPLPNHNDFRIRKDKYNNSSLNEKLQNNSISEKMNKTYFSFKLSHSPLKIISPNNTNLINHFKLQSFQPSSINSITKRSSKSLVNIDNKEDNKENEKIQKDNNNINNINETKTLNKQKKNNKNINKGNLINNYKNILKKEPESKQNESIIDKEKSKNDKDNDYSKILTDYLEYINQKKNINLISDKSSSLNINNDISKKNIKSNMFESKSCLNLNINKKKYKGINFEKMLSRKYLDKINRFEEPIHPMITPSYSSVEPKSIMKVLYSKKIYNQKPEKFHGFNGEFTYDINKIYYKYNNHISPVVTNFNKMSGRKIIDKNSLPFFMMGLSDRNSIETFNENSFKMNNYSNGSLKEIKSSFNDKKTYNIRLQLEELKKNNNKINILEYKNKSDTNNMIKKKMYKKINFKYKEDTKIDNNNLFNKTLKNKSWKSLLGDFYKINLDELEKFHSFIGTKVDGITLKTYKNKDKYPNLLTKKEKKIFLCDIK